MDSSNSNHKVITKPDLDLTYFIDNFRLTLDSQTVSFSFGDK